MLVRFTKNPPGAEGDLLACARPDGSHTEGEMARRAIIPHEAFRIVVETTLGWRDGFYALIARGATIAEATAVLSENARAGRRALQALQSESLIECFEAEQSAGPADPSEFARLLINASRRRRVDPPDVTEEELDRIRVALRRFGAAWRPMRPGASIERTY